MMSRFKTSNGILTMRNGLAAQAHSTARVAWKEGGGGYREVVVDKSACGRDEYPDNYGGNP